MGQPWGNIPPMNATRKTQTTLHVKLTEDGRLMLVQGPDVVFLTADAVASLRFVLANADRGTQVEIDHDGARTIRHIVKRMPVDEFDASDYERPKKG